MKTAACAAMTLGCAMFVIGCSEATKQKASDAKKKAGEAASSAVDDASKKAGNGLSEAKDKAQEAMDALGKEFTEATGKAKSALEGVNGGPELLQNITDLFASAQKSLQGVTNSETAQAAKTQLGELSGKVEGLSKQLEGLPEEAKTAVSGLIEKGIAQLKALSDKVMAIPGVGETIKPQLDALMEKLAALKG